MHLVLQLHTASLCAAMQSASSHMTASAVAFRMVEQVVCTVFSAPQVVRGYDGTRTCTVQLKDPEGKTRYGMGLGPGRCLGIRGFGGWGLSA